ncbi:ABC transporter ATP-binding protein [Gorillibacterium timonense]|uniref:ABC transporter ATP-binding protein n=1 Tax=Gorillibacterium timonense TaxID=1689269 RepID=UPI00071CD1A2|nr:ABC transporter ATP-binding protein [Gorillibacterium timonense]
MASEYALEVEGLNKHFDRFQLKDVTFRIPRGYIMGFVGRNGAGKTTTIKCILDLIKGDSGQIRVFGEDYARDPIGIRDRIGYVSEEAHFYEEMTVAWTGKFVGKFYSRFDDGDFTQWLRRFQVDPAKKVKELSRGMKVKLSLALALSHHPELLLLDEPTSGLDPVVRSELLEVFLELLQDENCTIFFSSHISSDMEKIADYITLIDNGQVLLSDEKHKLLDEWTIVKADNRFRSPELDALLTGVKAGEFGYSGIVKDVSDFRRRFAARYPGADYKTDRLTLDELLLRMTREEGVVC